SPDPPTVGFEVIRSLADAPVSETRLAVTGGGATVMSVPTPPSSVRMNCGRTYCVATLSVTVCPAYDRESTPPEYTGFGAFRPAKRRRARSRPACVRLGRSRRRSRRDFQHAGAGAAIDIALEYRTRGGDQPIVAAAQRDRITRGRGDHAGIGHRRGAAAGDDD